MSAKASSKRAYHSPVRVARAAKTRAAIVEAAATLFEKRGYGGTTMAAIAAQAKVSVESVHGAGTKGELLLEAFRTRYTGEGGWRSVLETANSRELFASTDAEGGFDALLDLLVTSHRRSALLWYTVRSTARTEPRLQSAVDELVLDKYEAYQTTVEWMARLGMLKPIPEGRRPVHLAASMNIIMSAETYVQLVHDWGFSEGDYRDWIRTAITQADV